jgi:glutamate-1-semialdehyde 2,1-aminomutase
MPSPVASSLAPSQFEAAFISLAHSDEDIEKTIRAVEEALADLV